MIVHMRVLLLIVLLSTSLAIAGNKKKPLLPAYVLKARTVVVLIDPNAGTSLTSPLANKTAQEDVEKALMKWGRFTPVMEHADGGFGDHCSQGLWKNGSADDRRLADQRSSCGCAADRQWHPNWRAERPSSRLYATCTARYKPSSPNRSRAFGGHVRRL